MSFIQCQVRNEHTIFAVTECFLCPWQGRCYPCKLQIICKLCNKANNRLWRKMKTRQLNCSKQLLASACTSRQLTEQEAFGSSGISNRVVSKKNLNPNSAPTDQKKICRASYVLRSLGCRVVRGSAAWSVQGDVTDARKFFDCFKAMNIGTLRPGTWFNNANLANLAARNRAPSLSRTEAASSWQHNFLTSRFQPFHIPHTKKNAPRGNVLFFFWILPCLGLVPSRMDSWNGTIILLPDHFESHRAVSCRTWMHF